MNSPLEQEIIRLKEKLALSQKVNNQKQRLIIKLKRRNEFLESYPYYSKTAYINKRKDEVNRKVEK